MFLPTPGAHVDPSNPSLAVAPIVHEPSATPTPTAAAVTPAALKTADPGDFNDIDREVMNQMINGFKEGRYLETLASADQVMSNPAHSQSFRNWLDGELPAILMAAGWQSIKNDHCSDAIRTLRRVQTLGKSPMAAKGLAWCYYKEKDFLSSSPEFEDYLKTSPTDLDMLGLYADVLESNQRYSDAISTLEQILANPTTTQWDLEKIDLTKKRLVSMRARAKESRFQQTVTSRNFALTYRGVEHEHLTQHVIETLEGALEEFVDEFGFSEPTSPIEVILYPGSYFRAISSGGPTWAEGFFDGRIRIPVSEEIRMGRDAARLANVLRHELVHALLTTKTGWRNLPSWFDEGLAQRLACGRQGCPKTMFDPTPGDFLDPQALATRYTSMDAVRAGRAYQQSLYLVKNLEQTYGREGLGRLVKGLKPNSDVSSDGLLSPLGLTFAQLHQNTSKRWAIRDTKL